VIGRMSGKDGKAPVKTLGTTTAMRMEHRDVIGSSATHRMLDKRSAAVIEDRSDKPSVRATAQWC
jgi:hypothetical protein